MESIAEVIKKNLRWVLIGMCIIALGLSGFKFDINFLGLEFHLWLGNN